METAFPWLKIRQSLGRVTQKPYFFLLLVGFLALWPLWTGRFFAIGDMRDVFIPLESFFREELLAGRLPAWNPHASWGFPVVAAAQIGFWYPPLLLSRWLPLWIYLPAMLLLHLSAGGLGTYFLLRATQRSHYAALFGAVSFMLSGFLWQHLTHLNIFLCVAWLPWQLWLVTRLTAKKQHRWRDGVLLGLVLGMPFLIGQLQIPLLMLLLSLSYLVWLAVFSADKKGDQDKGIASLLKNESVITGDAPGIPGHRPEQQSKPADGGAGVGRTRSRIVFQQARIMLLALVTVIGITAVQVLPTLELLQFSTRSEQATFDIVRANQHSFPLYHLPTYLFPRFFGSDDTYWGKRLEIEYGTYVGVLPLLLVVWLLATQWQTVRRNRTLLFWSITGLVSFLLALGDLSPFRLVGLEPSLWYFSAPARWLLLTTMSFIILAAHAFDIAVSSTSSFSRWYKKCLVVILAAVLLGNVGLVYLPRALDGLMPYVAQQFSDETPQAYYQEKLASLVTSIRSSSISLLSPTSLVTIAVLLGIWLLWPQRNRAQVLLLLTAAEMIFFATTLTPTLPWKDALQLPETATHLPKNVIANQTRLVSIQPPGGDTGAWLTNPDSRPSLPDRQLQRQLLLPLFSAQHHLAGIAWPASLDLRSQASVLERINLGDSNTFNIPLAAAHNVGALLIPTDLPQPNLLKLDEINDIGIYELPAAPRAEFIGPTTRLPIPYTAPRPDEVTLAFTSPEDGVVTIRDTFYPGWQAQLDGKSVPITLADDFFRKVAVPAGEHVLTMRYRPTALYIGLAVTVASLLLSFIVLMLPRMLP